MKHFSLKIAVERILLTSKGAKSVHRQSYRTREHITLPYCASAAGLSHPPMIIYSNSFPGGLYHLEGPEDALYCCSESGWIATELFMVWTRKKKKDVVPERPVLLLTDGYKTHINIEVINLCHENDILFYIPTHTMYALQPLDVAVFKSLKE